MLDTWLSALIGFVVGLLGNRILNKVSAMVPMWDIQHEWLTDKVQFTVRKKPWRHLLELILPEVSGLFLARARYNLPDGQSFTEDLIWTHSNNQMFQVPGSIGRFISLVTIWKLSENGVTTLRNWPLPKVFSVEVTLLDPGNKPLDTVNVDLSFD